MTFWQLVGQHYLIIGGIAGYVALTEIRFMPKPGDWKGLQSIYAWQYDVLQSLAASAPAQRLEAKFSVTSPDGTSKTQTLSTEAHTK